MGVRHGLRTTFVRMRDGRLWVHSPIALSDALRRDVDALGEVGCLVAPNNHHHRWLLAWHAAYPSARVFVSRDVPRKLPQLRAYELLAQASAPPWHDALDHAVMPGVPFFDESVFLHRATRSLIVTDLIQNHEGAGGATNPAARLAARMFALIGFRGVCVAPPLRLRWLQRDPAALRAFLEQVGGWSIERIIVSHGRIVDRQAQHQLQAALRAAKLISNRQH